MNNKQLIINKIQELINDKQVPGVSYSFVDTNNIEEHYLGNQGYVDPFLIPLSKDMYYDVASVSKVVATTTRILQLLEENKLTLDTKVSSILSKFKHQDVTIENLLMHNSGLATDLKDKTNLTKEKILTEVYTTPLEYPTGEKAIYSDIGFILLGEVIVAIDKISLEETMQKHIFQKLNMNHTSYIVTDDKKLYVPTEYKADRGGFIQGETHDTKGYLLGPSGHAGIFSSLYDLSLFAQAFFKPNTLLKPETIELLKEKTVHGRGLGWEKKYGDQIINHTGFTGTSMVIDLDKQQAFVFLTNRVHPSRDTPQFLEERNNLNILFTE